MNAGSDKVGEKKISVNSHDEYQLPKIEMLSYNVEDDWRSTNTKISQYH